MGDDAVALCEIADLYLDPWQEIALRQWLGKRPTDLDRWAHRQCGLIVPRQNGKGVILEARQLFGLFRVPTERLIIHTAHEFKTATESFTRLASLVEDEPKLSKYVKDIYTANGKEAVILKDGSRVKFLARSKKSGRGFSSDLLIFDEAMILPPETVGAAGPTQSARPNPQTIYTATAGDGDSEALAKLRDDGIAGAERLTYVEYSAGSPDDHVGDDVDLDDRDESLRANPAMHGPNPRMTFEDVEFDRRSMDDENFARERLCLWWVQKRVSVINADQWEKVVRKSEPAESVVFAVDVPPERDSASIAVGSVRDDGKVHVELIEHKAGTGWVVPRLVELDKDWTPEHIAVQPTSPAGSLISDIKKALEEKRVPVLDVSGGDYAKACGKFLDDVNNGKVVVHRGDHINDLTAAVDVARKRELSEGSFVWNRRDTTGNIAPLVAATLALFATGQKAKKRRKRRTKNPF